MTDHPVHAPKEGKSLLDEVATTTREPAPEGTTTLQIRAFLGVAMAKHQEGQLAEAEHMYRQVLRWEPNHPDAYHLLGLLAAQLNRPEDALPLFEHAIALNPAVPEYHANYACVDPHVAARGRRSGFAKEFSPRFSGALMNLATLRPNHGDLEGGAAALPVAELRPNWPDAQINLANVAFAHRRFDEATALFASALGAEPSYVHAYEAFARAACRAGKPAEAAAAFRRLLAFDPDNAVAEHLLAACVSDPHYQKAPECTAVV
jgi:tetratricopeptide (TPR) repeat protein